MSATGILIPIGGNENKGIATKEIYNTEKIEDSILARIVSESGGRDAMILIIPTASSIPDEVVKNYLDAFAELYCSNVQVVDIRKREDSASTTFLDLAEKADCILFSGGNQSEITQKIGGTKFHKILQRRYNNDGLVIAGTSAGAMCMSREMITGGKSKEAFLKGAVGMSKGMSFVPSLIIDSHFIRRGRFGRLAEAVARFPKLIGVGLAENTGLVIKNCNSVEVIGSGMVIIFDPSALTNNTESLVEKRSPMSITNLKTHILSKGDTFNIDRHQVEILHVEKPEVNA
ncbi:cyanophycinase [Flavimarina sp. Hel_I_48]|uniref:cyanophycinase n=1 Tax=Flavimarina sp. Hel_I_48 TaxID=1392488 RepID=UPI0004DFB651|nr:cyanophycinase [Flavimarina sp. Hel_I_48]